MSIEPLTCPYCNAQVPVAPEARAGQRVPCPRCGEAFTLRPSQVTSTAPPPASGVTTAPAPAVNLAPVHPSLRSPRANRLIAALVLGVMVLMAGGGLTLALLTQKDRRANDTHMSRRSRRSPVPVEPAQEAPAAPLPPSRLAALGYLRPGSSVIAGIHVAEVLAEPGGRDLLTAPLRVGSFELRLDGITRWTGLAPEELDHLVLGINAHDPLPPRFSLVARTRRPYDAARVRAALKARHVSGAGSKELDRFEVEGLPLALWCADERTVVVGLFDKRQDLVQSPPHEDLDQLPEEVRGALRERLDPAGPVWAVGHARDWAETPALLLFQRLRKEDLERVRRVRTFAVQLQLDRTVMVKAAFQCDNADSSRDLEEFFRRLKKGERRELTMLRDGPWLLLQYQTDLGTVREALQR